VALFDEDPLKEWSESTSLQEPPNVVAVEEPYIHTTTELEGSPYLLY
jgi:hypothetical protein